MDLKAGREQQAEQHLAAAVQACRQLVALHPADAGFKLQLGSIAMYMRESGQLAVQTLRAAVAAADTSTGKQGGVCSSQSLFQPILCAARSRLWERCSADN